jgi:hypothetical protein
MLRRVYVMMECCVSFSVQDRLLDSEDEDIKLFQNVTTYLPVKPSKRETFGQLDDEGKLSDHPKYRQLLSVDKT